MCFHLCNFFSCSLDSQVLNTDGVCTVKWQYNFSITHKHIKDFSHCKGLHQFQNSAIHSIHMLQNNNVLQAKHLLNLLYQLSKSACCLNILARCCLLICLSYHVHSVRIEGSLLSQQTAVGDALSAHTLTKQTHMCHKLWSTSVFGLAVSSAWTEWSFPFLPNKNKQTEHRPFNISWTTKLQFLHACPALNSCKTIPPSIQTSGLLGSTACLEAPSHFTT